MPRALPTGSTSTSRRASALPSSPSANFAADGEMDADSERRAEGASLSIVDTTRPEAILRISAERRLEGYACGPS